MNQQSQSSSINNYSWIVNAAAAMKDCAAPCQSSSCNNYSWSPPTFTPSATVGPRPWSPPTLPLHDIASPHPWSPPTLPLHDIAGPHPWSPLSLPPHATVVPHPWSLPSFLSYATASPLSPTTLRPYAATPLPTLAHSRQRHFCHPPQPADSNGHSPVTTVSM